MMTLAKIITTCREKRGLSQEALAERLNITAAEVAAWEKGESEPAIKELAALSQALDVSIDELVTDSPTHGAAETVPSKPDARIFLAIATACNVLGFLYDAMFSDIVSKALGLTLVVIGITVYVIGLCVSSEESKQWVHLRFWAVNIWFLAYWPAMAFRSGIVYIVILIGCLFLYGMQKIKPVQ